MSHPTIQIHPGSRSGPQYALRSETNGRENNEDSFMLLALSPALGLPPLYILALADGMGGHAHGEHLSRETLRKVSLSLCEQLCLEPALNHLRPVSPLAPAAIAAALWNALQQANRHAQRMIESNHWDKSGSTVVIAIIGGHHLVAANLGDSPLFHYRPASGRLTQVTEDHTVAGALLRANIITAEMARHHEGRSRLEYYVGGDTLPHQPTTYQLDLRPGDLLLLCSDGVSGLLSAGQIGQILSDSGSNLALSADRLLQAARSAGETDNQTLILWQHSGPVQVDLASQPTLVMENPGQRIANSE